MKYLVYFLVLSIRYILVTGDVKHFVHYCMAKVEVTVSLALLGLFLLLEILTLFPKLLPSFSLKLRARAHLALHILIAVNSIYWLILNKDTSIFGVVTFVIAFASSLYIGNKILDAIHNDDND